MQKKVLTTRKHSTILQVLKHNARKETIMKHENAKQVAARDKLHDDFVKSLAPGQVLTHYHTHYCEKTSKLYVVLMANWELMPVISEEVQENYTIGPKGAVSKWFSKK